MSSLDLNWARATSCLIASCSGNGVTSFHVLSFCYLRSNMVRNVLFFFGIQSMGVACLSAAAIHHPAMVYHSILWASSGRKASGHLGNLCLSCFDSSIKGISWRTSRSGGNYNGSGPNKSLNSSAISSHNWGISSSIYLLIGFFNPNSMWDGRYSQLFLFSIFAFFSPLLPSVDDDGSGDSQWLSPRFLPYFSVFSLFTAVLFWEFLSLILYSPAWLRMILSLIVRQSFVKSIITLNFFRNGVPKMAL